MVPKPQSEVEASEGGTYFWQWRSTWPRRTLRRTQYHQDSGPHSSPCKSLRCKKSAPAAGEMWTRFGTSTRTENPRQPSRKHFYQCCQQ